MSPELEKKIIEKYPKLFPPSDEEFDRKIYYNLSCGDGWYSIIDVLCKNIQYYVDQQVAGLDEEDSKHYQVRVEEIKEKFGSLRFYATNTDEYISGMIMMAESLSCKICEDCGSKADLTTKGWIKNLCNSCNAKIENKRRQYASKNNK